MSVLTILPVNKTVVFYSPIEGENTLVRTGTIGDGSCFFHALLHAYSKDYASMDQTGRRKYVKRLRASIASKVDKNQWENLSGGLIAKIPFQENINSLLSEFYVYIKSSKLGSSKSFRKVIQNINEKDIDAYKLIIEMIPLEEFEKNILPSVYKKCETYNVSKCKNYIKKYAVKYYKKMFDLLNGKLDKDRINFYLKKLKHLMGYIADEAEQSAYIDYIENLNNSSMEVDSYTIGIISEKFNRDIYFIDSRTRMPYRDANDKNTKKRKSIIVMWTGGCHYEIVGKLLTGNRIQREFSKKDEIIQRLYTYLCDPEKVPKKYPNLIPYLPKKIRLKLGNRSPKSSNSDRSPKSSNSDRSPKSNNSDRSPKSNNSVRSPKSSNSGRSPKSNNSVRSPKSSNSGRSRGSSNSGRSRGSSNSARSRGSDSVNSSYAHSDSESSDKILETPIRPSKKI
jgi:hypothetical protein